MFSFSAEFFQPTQINLTKRAILWAISNLFDYLGLVSPIVVRAKLRMQRLREFKLKWDDPVPSDFGSNFQNSYQKSINIPRLALYPNLKHIE